MTDLACCSVYLFNFLSFIVLVDQIVRQYGFYEILNNFKMKNRDPVKSAALNIQVIDQ